MQYYQIINKLIWIDSKVNNFENLQYQNKLKSLFGLQIEAYNNAVNGINALSKIQFESIFVITSGTIYPEFFYYMKTTFKELRVLPFSIIFTSSAQDFLIKHQFDEIGKIYNKTFFNRGGVVDSFNGVIAFINEIYSKLNSFQTYNRYQGIFTKNYTGLIVFEAFNNSFQLPPFFDDIYLNKHINYSELYNFTIFFLQNFCNDVLLIKLLKPLVLFKEVPEEIVSKYWARMYTYETPFYSIMNKTLMQKMYKEYEVYIKLLYKGLACNSYRPKFTATLSRGTKLELSEINYLKSIAGTNQIIINKSFLSFSLNKEKSIKFQDNTTRVAPESLIPVLPINSSFVVSPQIPRAPLPLEEPIPLNALNSSLEIIPQMDYAPLPLRDPIPVNTLNSSLRVNPLLPYTPLPLKAPTPVNKLNSSFGAKHQIIYPALPKKNIIKQSQSVLIEILNINEYEKNNYLISNAFLKDISYYSKEEEVLVFPFTGFKVVSWNNATFQDQKGNQVEGTSFTFKFSKEYLQKIKKKYANYYY